MKSALQLVFACIFSIGLAQAQALPPTPAGSAPPAQTVSFASLDGTAITGTLFMPAAPAPGQPALPKGTVIALHGCGGLYTASGPRQGQLSPRHQAMAELLQSLGYAVLLPDSLTPRGERELCTQKIGTRSITQTQRRADALGALNWAAAQPWARADKVALLGWSNGGSTVLAATDATRRDVQAQPHKFALAVAFYPGCSAPLQSGYQANSKLVMMLGELDDWTAPAPCIALGQSIGAEVNVYPGAYHDFDNPSGSVRVRKDVPNGANPGQGVHAGPNPAARELAYARLKQVLGEAFP